MQRLTRYPLLLRAIAQQTDSDSDMADLGTMVRTRCHRLSNLNTERRT